MQIDAFTLEDVQDFYQKQFGAKRTELYVAGVFDGNEMKEAISSSLSNFREGPESNIPVAEHVTKADMIVLDRSGKPQSSIVLGLPVVDSSHPDFMQLRVANSLLVSSFGSRKTSNIRGNKGYTYSPYSSIATRYKAGDWS